VCFVGTLGGEGGGKGMPRLVGGRLTS